MNVYETKNRNYEYKQKYGQLRKKPNGLSLSFSRNYNMM